MLAAPSVSMLRRLTGNKDLAEQSDQMEGATQPSCPQLIIPVSYPSMARALKSTGQAKSVIGVTTRHLSH